MATYFFNWRCGADRIDDTDGREADDLPAAITLGIFQLRGLIGQDAMTGTIRMAQRIDIEDARHHLVHRLAVPDAITFV